LFKNASTLNQIIKFCMINKKQLELISKLFTEIKLKNIFKIKKKLKKN